MKSVIFVVLVARTVGVWAQFLPYFQPYEYAMDNPNVNIYMESLHTITNVHLAKMTAEIFQDAAVKMRIVRSNGEMYKGNSQFLIGSIVSNIYGLFSKMGAIYKYTCGLYRIRYQVSWDSQYSFENSLLGFGIVQSLHHQIRLEKKLFDEVIREKVQEDKKKKRELKKKFGKMFPQGLEIDDPFKGGMYVERRTNVDKLFNEDDFDSNFELPILSSRKNKKSIIQETDELYQTRSNAHLLRNPYASSKNNEYKKAMYSLRIQPSDFQIPPANSSVMKIMTQLNIDNPGLNPDLGAYQNKNHRGRARLSDGVQKQKSKIDSFTYRSRRMGSDSNASTQQPRRSSSYATDQQSRKLDSYASAQQLRRSHSYAAAQQPRNPDSFAVSQQPRRLNSYSSTQQPRRSNTYNEQTEKRLRYLNERANRPPKRPDSYRPLWSPKSDFDYQHTAGDKKTANLNDRRSRKRIVQQPHLEAVRSTPEQPSRGPDSTLKSRMLGSTRYAALHPFMRHAFGDGRRYNNGRWTTKKKRAPIWKPKPIN